MPHSESFHGENALHIYDLLSSGGKSCIKVGRKLTGKKIKDLINWEKSDCKDEIMRDAMKFKEYLREISDNATLFKDPKLVGIPTSSIPIMTPILSEIYETQTISTIEDIIREYEKGVNGNISAYFSIPDKLVNTDLGRKILNELKSIDFGDSVFCHNYLCYKSFVLHDNKLIGITNWQYAGYYPPEFEDVIEKYIKYL